MNSALLLLEFQNDYFPNGRISLEKSLEACVRAEPILHTSREKNIPIIYLQHISTQTNATNLLPCTKGSEFYPSLQPRKNEIVIKKHYPNSFKDTALLSHLTKLHINHLIICGMMTHTTIDATVRAAYDYGFNCTVLYDACAARQLEFNHNVIPAHLVHYAFLAALQPTYAMVMSTEEFLQKSSARIPAVA